MFWRLTCRGHEWYFVADDELEASSIASVILEQHNLSAFRFYLLPIS